MKHKNPKWNLEGIVITFKQQSHVISSYILSHQIKYFNIQSRIEYAIPFFQFLLSVQGLLLHSRGKLSNHESSNRGAKDSDSEGHSKLTSTSS